MEVGLTAITSIPNYQYTDDSAIGNNPIKRGNKILTMNEGGNKIFRYTLLYMTCSLKKMNRCIGIDKCETYSLNLQK